MRSKLTLMILALLVFSNYACIFYTSEEIANFAGFNIGDDAVAVSAIILAMACFVFQVYVFFRHKIGSAVEMVFTIITTLFSYALPFLFIKKIDESYIRYTLSVVSAGAIFFIGFVVVALLEDRARKDVPIRL